MKKKIASLALVLALCLTFSPVMASAEDTANVWDGSVAAEFAGGTGTAEDPYQIATGSQLAYLASQVNSGTDYEDTYFILTADIDLNNIEWTPIGIHLLVRLVFGFQMKNIVHLLDSLMVMDIRFLI